MSDVEDVGIFFSLGIGLDVVGVWRGCCWWGGREFRVDWGEVVDMGRFV